ncbi:MAG: nucleotidyltransferase family protein [Solirubrobacteraceae bacterium]
MHRLWGTAAFGCWPDERQRLLVGAAVWGDERARGAWDRWRSGTTRAQIGAADGRLMATAYRPLRSLGADDPLLEIAGGLHRRAWYTNQLALRKAATVVRRLARAGHEVLVLKGAALCLLHYPDLGSRPMGDIDLLITPGALAGALPPLAELGWRLLPSQGTGQGPLAYGVHVEDELGAEIDLHEYSLMQSADDSDLWQARVGLELIDTPTATLAPSDHLLHVCAHGMRWHPDSNARWAVDAMMLMRSSRDELDWARVIDRAQARRLTVSVGHALSWLRTALGAEVPEWVVKGLGAGPRLRFERTVHAVAARPPSPLNMALMSLDRYRRFAQFAPPAQRPASFSDYLRGAWGAQSSRHVLRLGGRKLARRLP